jgi:LuxR family maltose regulon positive regulatory protein
VAAFSGSHRYVRDYLAEEVLDSQDPQVRAFLLETSVLGRLSGDLADAVTGRAGGQAMLERIERAGLFLLPLDEVRGWWRYHPLFADLLQARLAAELPTSWSPWTPSRNTSPTCSASSARPTAPKPSPAPVSSG